MNIPGNYAPMLFYVNLILIGGLIALSILVLYYYGMIAQCEAPLVNIDGICTEMKQR